MQSFEFHFSLALPQHSLYEIVDRLVPSTSSSAADDHSNTQKRKRDAQEPDTRSATTPPSSRQESLFLDMRLHPEEVRFVMVRAPSAEVRKAWAEGRLLPEWSHHRVRVVELPEAIVEERKEREDPPVVPQGLYDEGQEWWEECARESGSVQSLEVR